MVTDILVPLIAGLVLVIALLLIPGSLVWKIVGILSIVVLAITVWSMLRRTSYIDNLV